MIRSRAVINWQALGGMRIFLASVVTCKISGGSERLHQHRRTTVAAVPGRLSSSWLGVGPRGKETLKGSGAGNETTREGALASCIFVWCLFPIR